MGAWLDVRARRVPLSVEFGKEPKKPSGRGNSNFENGNFRRWTVGIFVTDRFFRLTIC